MHPAIVWLGGGCYLLNKAFFSIFERTSRGKKAKLARFANIASWLSYLVGLPLWVVIFCSRHNWIGAGLEASGTPALTLGLIASIYGDKKKSPRWLDISAKLLIPIGLIASIVDFHGIHKLSQWLEIGLTTGFLVGAYQVYKHKPSGYLWFGLMHFCCGWLMKIQHQQVLYIMQLFSLVFVADAYFISKRKQAEPAQS